MNKCLSIFVVPILELQHTPLPPKVLRAMERAPALDFFDVFTLNSHLSLSKSLGMRHIIRHVCKQGDRL